MKKRIWLLLALLLAALLCVGLVSCDESGKDSEEEEGGTVTVTYYITEGGSPTKVVVYDGEFALTKLPTRTGYTFLGLYDSPTGGSQIMNEKGVCSVSITRSVTLYAQWQPIAYTVRLNANGGSLTGETTLSAYYEQGMPMLPTPMREGFDFVGWFTSYGTQISVGSAIKTEYATFNDQHYPISDGEVVLVARWTEKKVNVVFDYNDGTYQRETVPIEYGENINVIRFPEKDTGFRVIIGWSTSNLSMIEYEGEVKQDITLYAIWKEYKTVSFYTHVDGTPEQIRIYEGDSPYVCSTPSMEDYDFGGWFSSTLFSGVPLTQITFASAPEALYAKWSPMEYTLSFKVGSESPLPDQIFTQEDTFELPTVSKEQSVFLGWCRRADLSDTPILVLPKGTKGDITLYAKFRGESKNVVLEKGEGTLSVISTMVEYGKTFSLPTPSREGYRFMGWFTAENGGGEQITLSNGKGLGEWDRVEDSTTLYAHYEKLYTITVEFDSNAGTVDRSDPALTEGETATITAQPRSGYRFLGFYVNGELVCTDLEYSFVIGTENVSVTASFEANTYHITLDASGGFCKETEMDVVFGQEYTLPVVWKQGYVFKGWKSPTASEDSTEVITDNQGKGLSTWSFAINVVLSPVFEEDPEGDSFLLVYDAASFLSMKDNPGKTYSLVGDIDMSGVTWTPFAFSGILNGNGFTVSNLTVNDASTCTGIFSSLTGTVRDINFANLHVTSTNTNPSAGQVGGIAGEVKDKGSIERVQILSGSIKSTYGRVGGFVGGLYGNAIVRDCVNYATVEATGYDGYGAAGGIVGWYETNAGTLLNCENHGTVTGMNYTGGVAGRIYGSVLTIGNLKNDATVSGRNYVGGVIGELYPTASQNLSLQAENKGAVNGQSSVGGVLGQLYCYAGGTVTVTVTGMTNSAPVNGTTSIGGVIGYLYSHAYSSSIYTTIVDGVTNTGNVTGVNQVGGIVGFGTTDTYETKVINSTSTAVITAEHTVGGIAGYMENVLIDSCSNAGSTVTATGYLLQDSKYYTYLGGYVGRGAGVYNCENAVEIETTKQGQFVGGIAGHLTYSLVNCKNTASVTAESCSYVGGLAGQINSSASAVTFSGLSNTGDVRGVGYVGGIAGDIHLYSGGNYSLSIHDLSNEGDVTAKEQYAGGFVGYFEAYSYSSSLYTVVMEQVENTGAITGANHVGGLIGYGYSDTGASKLLQCSSSGNVTAEYMVGGIAGKLDGIMIDTCSNAGATVTATGYLLQDSQHYTYLGGYVGYGYGVVGCENTVDLTVTKQGQYVGGIAGYLTVSVNSCKNTGKIQASDCNYVGGIVGKLGTSSANSLGSLSNTGAITGKGYVGGIAGDAHLYSGGNYSLSVIGLSNEGAVTGSEAYVGGLVGYFEAYSYSSSVYTVVMEQAKNTGDVKGANHVGGLFGYGYTDTAASKIVSASSSGSITAEYMVGGLAGKLEWITLENCSNEGTTITATKYLLSDSIYYSYVGGYVGHGYTVTGCTNASAITLTQKGQLVGGIAGYLTGGMSNCSNTANIKAPSCDYVGGLAGRVYATALNSYSTLTNTGDISGAKYTGGLMGDFYIIGPNTQTQRFDGFVNSGDVSGGDYTGGISGYFHSAANSSSVWTGIVDGAKNTGAITGGAYVGGLFGYGYTDTYETKLLECASSGAVSGKYFVGGLAGRLDNIQINACSNEGATVTATGYLAESVENSIYVGGYVGYGYTVTDCKNETPLTLTQKANYVGGIAGYLTGGISGCSNTAAITATGCDYVGGLVGRIYTTSKNTYSDLSNTGKIAGNHHTGGLVGNFYIIGGSTQTQQFTGFTNAGAVSGGDYVGGLAGYLHSAASSSSVWTGIFEGAKNTGAVSGAAYVGGLVGYGYSDITDSAITGGSSSGAVSGKYYVGGIAGRLENIQINACSNAGATVTASGYFTESSINYVYVGGYVGYGYTVTDCKNEVALTLTQRANGVGGIAGFLNGSLTGCSNTAAITATGCDRVGGLVGQMDVSGLPRIESISNAGAVNGSQYVGGLVGKLNLYNGGNLTITMTGLSNSGTVKAASNDAGGLFGYLYAYSNSSSTYTVIIEGAKNTGDVTGTYHVGGLVGYGYTDNEASKLSGCTSAATITGEYLVGGFAGKLDLIGIENGQNEGSTIKATKYNLVDSVYYSYVGGFVGQGYWVTGSTNKVPITLTQKGRYVGGIGGYLVRGLENCSNEADITAKECSYVGGLVGIVSTTTINQYTSLSNKGAVTGDTIVGGIIGEYWLNASGTATQGFDNLTNTGKITGTTHTGGLFGNFYLNSSNSAFTLAASEWKNTGDVKGTYYVGGLVGKGSTDSTTSAIRESASSGTITAEYYVGGLAGHLTYIRLEDCSNEGTTLEVTKYELVDSVYRTYAGGYVGYGYAVDSCTNTIPITLTQKGNYVGGIAGFLSGGITNSSNKAAINAPSCGYVGGLVGQINTTSINTYSDLSNEGAVTGAIATGGLVGEYWLNASGTATQGFTGLTNTGKITGTTHTGGLFGNLYLNSSNSAFTLAASEWKNTGDVKGTYYVGGLVGKGSTDSTTSAIRESASSGKITAEHTVGGLAGHLTYIRMESCSNEGTELNVTKYDLVDSVYYTYAGGYIGYGYTARDCVNYAEILITHKGSYVGGIAGCLTDELVDCENGESVIAPECDYVGGLVGRSMLTYDVSMSDLANAGRVEGANFVGGIIGQLYAKNSGTRHQHMTTLINNGTVVGVRGVGGIAGEVYFESTNSTWTLTATGWKNTATVEGDTYVGGLVGSGITDTDASKIMDSQSIGAVKGSYLVGGLAGQLQYVTLESCSNEGASVTATGAEQVDSLSNAYVGGYVGKGYKVLDCINYVAIDYKAGGRFVGGIAGYLSLAVSSCENRREVVAPSSDYVGGLVGFIQTGSNVTMENLKNIATVRGKSYVGGLMGSWTLEGSGQGSAIFQELANTGTITASGDYVGGLFGHLYANSSRYAYTVSALNLSNQGGVTGNTYVAGLIGYVYTDASDSSLTGASNSGAVSASGTPVSDTIAEAMNFTIKE